MPAKLGAPSAKLGYASCILLLRDATQPASSNLGITWSAPNQTHSPTPRATDLPRVRSRRWHLASRSITCRQILKRKTCPRSPTMRPMPKPVKMTCRFQLAPCVCMTRSYQNVPVRSPTVGLLYGDNIQANKLCREQFVTTGNQYIYLPYHFAREAQQLGIIDVKWVKTQEQAPQLCAVWVHKYSFKG